VNFASFLFRSFCCSHCGHVAAQLWIYKTPENEVPLPSMLWHCRLDVRKSIWSVKIEWWSVGVVICLERGADCLHMVQLLPLPYKTWSSLASFKFSLVFTARCSASAVIAMALCLSVCLSLTRRCSTKTAERRITQTTPHNSPGTLVFWCQRCPRNSTGVTPYRGAKCRCGGSKSATFDLCSQLWNTLPTDLRVLSVTALPNI